MVFINDTRVTLDAVAALVNTDPATSSEAHEGMVTAQDLDAFLRAHPYSGNIRRNEQELAELRAIRPRLLALWAADRSAAVPLVNAMLEDGKALPRLVIHDEFDWHIHATDDSDSLATRILVEAAMAFVDIIRSDEYDRVRVCEADDCQSVYVDFSRNGSKRYCDAGNCGNRMNVNAYRRRRALQENG